MFGDEIERLLTLHPLTGEVVTTDDELYVFPATHYVAGPERMERAINGIEAELAVRLGELDQAGKLLEAQRLRMRTTYDIEMLRQVGSCSGIENYSRHIDGREAVRILRKNGFKAPIIMLTGHSEKRRVTVARDAGVTEFLAKPITAQNLFTRIAEIVERPRAFVRCDNYFGPDRRRRQNDDYPGPWRRKEDLEPTEAR